MALFLTLLIVLATGLPVLGGCSGSRNASMRSAEAREDAEREAAEREEEEKEEFEHRAPPEPMQWGTGLTVEAAEGRSDTIRFHIGSPLFLRVRIAGTNGCTPFNGRPFFFDAAGSQLGWGFEEVADSLLFRRAAGACERVLMLSSESSNRLAEGVYSFKTLFFLDDGSKLYSDTIVITAVRATDGADSISYARFLQEQIVRRSPLLADPETLRALFAPGTPSSAESEVYRAVLLARAGDLAGAEQAVKQARARATQRGRALDAAAANAALALEMTLHPASQR
jgi:hypothetical protein